MRCNACNVVLSTAESVRKFSSGEFVDLCNKCLNTIQDDITTEDSLYEKGDEDEDEL